MRRTSVDGGDEARLNDNTGEVIGTQGFYIDVKPTGEVREASISEAVAEIADNRAVIDQAKCALMHVYRVDADAAFDVLKWRSQETNVKLRALAEQLLADVRTLKRDDSESFASARCWTTECRHEGIERFAAEG